MKATDVAAKLIIFGLILTGLYIGKDLLIPFVIAVVAWYLLNSLANLFSHIRIRKKAMPRTLQLILGMGVLSMITFVLIRMVMRNYELFQQALPEYQANFLHLTQSLEKTFHLKLDFASILKQLDLSDFFAGAVDSSFGFLSNFFLVLLYVIFLLLEQPIFDTKLRQIYKDREDYARFLRIIRKLDGTIHTYVSAKTTLCLVSAILSYVVMISVGVDFAILWASLIFLFSFIPIIGPLLGVVMPSLMALLQFDTILHPVLLVSLLTVIQFAIGNFVEPRFLGSRLNLSPLAVMLSLAFWGALWGIAGMFLCVPITVILMIIFSQFPNTRSLAIILSGGKVIQ